MIGKPSIAALGVLAVALTPSVNAHGMLTKPVSRALREGGGISGNAFMFAGNCPGSACEWYTQRTVIPGKTTNCDPALRTMGVHCSSERPDWPCTPGHGVPWCAPGSAPVKSPCGVFSGGWGQDTRDMLELTNTPQETWTAGETAQVAWAVTANHGGGYGYRICPQDSDLSEECFQAGHLEFVGNTQQIVNTSGDIVTTIPAYRVSNGTTPPNSQWTRNPFPQEAEYLPRIPGLESLYGRGPFPYSVMDTIQVPAGVKPGKYVLSWRWEAEQTKQVWSHCSDVTIVASGTSKETKQILEQAPTTQFGNNSVCTGASLGLDIADCNAWVDFYDSLGGPNWPADWAQECDSIRTDPCGCKTTWQKHIVCSGIRDYEHITEIYMLSSNLIGQIPASFTKLNNLRALSLVDTLITGTLPQNMGDMSALTYIWVDHNMHLGGEIPSSLGKLNLSVIEAHRSNFSGTLPPLDYINIADCTLNDLIFSCPLPAGADSCGALCM